MTTSILFEWNHEDALEVRREEGREAGLAEDMARAASDMLKDGEPIAKILKYSKLSEDTIRNIAHSLCLAIQ